MPRSILLGGWFIVFATLAAYWPVFSAGFIWDDDAYVTDNALLSAPDGWSRIWFSAHSQSQYFPLVFTTLRVESALWGLNPVGYHVVNVSLHIVNALLVWALLRRLALPRAWLAAAIFALHPVQVETVAWVTELKNTESTLFYLLAVVAWLNFCAGKGRWFYALALGLHALALFAKTTACTLPAVLLLVLWVKSEPVNWRRILQILPFLLLGFGMGLLSVWWENHLGNYLPKFHLLGGPLDRLLIATHALWFYAQKIFWPASLTFSYPRWNINADDWRQYLWLIGCLVVAAVLWFARRKLGRGPAAALIFFAAVLLPMLGFIPLYTFYFSFVADHYQYFACLGLIVLGLGLAAKFFEASQADRRLQAVLTALLLLILGAHTWQQCHIYKNLETLWTDTLKKIRGVGWRTRISAGCWCNRENLPTRKRTTKRRCSSTRRKTRCITTTAICWREPAGWMTPWRNISRHWNSCRKRRKRTATSASPSTSCTGRTRPLPNTCARFIISPISPKRITTWATRFRWSIKWMPPSPPISAPCGWSRIRNCSENVCRRWARRQNESAPAPAILTKHIYEKANFETATLAEGESHQLGRWRGRHCARNGRDDDVR